MMNTKSLVLVAGLVSGVAAALSSGCQSELTSLALSSQADCLNFAGLVPLATLSSSASIVPAIESYLTGLCSNGPSCTSDTVTSIATNLTKACSSDLEGLGLGSGTVAQLPALIEQYYSVAVNAVCLRNNNDTTSPFCSSSLLVTLQSSINQNLTTSNIVSSLTAVLSNTTLEQSLACTTCAQGMYGTVRPSLNATLQTELDSELNGICGTSAANSTGVPNGVVEATGSLATQSPTGAPASSTSGAASSISVRGSTTTSVVGAFIALGGVVVGSALVAF